MNPAPSSCSVLAAACCAVLLPMLAGCVAPGRVPPRPVNSPAETGAMTIPPGFLFTSDPVLGRWMDERFEVVWRNLTPELVFDQDPVSDIRYHTSGLPQEASKFHVQSASISRRELLHRVAEFWDLEMTLVMFDGRPDHVRVAGKGSRS